MAIDVAACTTVVLQAVINCAHTVCEVRTLRKKVVNGTWHDSQRLTASSGCMGVSGSEQRGIRTKQDVKKLYERDAPPTRAQSPAASRLVNAASNGPAPNVRTLHELIGGGVNLSTGRAVRGDPKTRYVTLGNVHRVRGRSSRSRVTASAFAGSSGSFDCTANRVLGFTQATYAVRGPYLHRAGDRVTF